MYIIAGLGNPGKQYEGTRHNAGFHAVDYLALVHRVKVSRLKFKGLYGEGQLAGEKMLLVKPQTFMNLSGESLRDFVNFYKVPPENLIVLYDEAALPTGKLRIRTKGSAGGHNGIKSIIYQLGTEDFVRLRIGVGAPQYEGQDLADHVLGKFAKEEFPLMDDAIKRAAEAVEMIVKEGPEKAMSRFNG